MEERPPGGISDALVETARQLQAELTTQHTLERAVALAVELIDGCDYAALSVVHRSGNIDTVASTGEVARRGDELQYSFREGPCLEAIWEQDTIRIPRLSEEDRWPIWAPAAAFELGVQSMVCLQLYTTAETLGALNLYSRRDDASDEDDINAATVLAANIAAAMAESQHAAKVHSASLKRTIIGQAQGILMERFSLGPDTAFNVLGRVSQDHRMQLHQVAAELLRTRETPGGERTVRDLAEQDRLM